MNTNDFEIETHAPEETESLGSLLVSELPEGCLVALYGDLASGKTCLVRGMAKAAAGNDLVHSPTFTLVNEYGPGPRLYHLDLYRLDGPREIMDLGYEELFDGEVLCVVEWAERAGSLLPDPHLSIRLEHRGGDTRHIAISDPGLLGPGWTARILDALGRSV